MGTMQVEAPAAWAPTTSFERFRLDDRGSGGRVSASVHTELASVPTGSVGNANEAKPWHPDNPLLWFGGLAAVAFGLMAFSTSVRVGKTTATVALGDTKGK